MDFSPLKQQLQSSTLLLPCDDGYAQSLERWSLAAQRNAAAVVLLGSEVDVSTAVQFAAQHNIEIAVRGGGHSSSGSSSVEGGLVLDLSPMRSVTVDADAQTATVQGGALWSDVDAETTKYGLGCVAGTVNHTGVGGLTLGGGYGWLSAKHGLVVDNLLSIRLVLADGTITTASATSHPDLFWAVRGAGAAFGVATSFTFSAHPVPSHVTAGLLAFPPDQLDAVTDCVNSFHAHQDDTCGLMLGITTPPISTSPAPLVIAFYHGPKPLAEEKFAAFLALRPMLNTLDEIPYVELNGVINAAVPHGSRRGTNGASIPMPLDKSLVRMAFDRFTGLVEDHPEAAGSIVVFEVLHAGKICEVAPTDTATLLRTENINVGIMTRWDDASKDVVMRAWSRSLGGDIQRLGNGNTFLYPNYSYIDSRSRDLFGVNYQRLVQLKKEYDPGNLFRSWHGLSGGRDDKEFAV